MKLLKWIKYIIYIYFLKYVGKKKEASLENRTGIHLEISRAITDLHFRIL